MNPTDVPKWAELAMRTGPFFFALLLFYLTWRFASAAEKRHGGGRDPKMWTGLTVVSYLLAAGVMVAALVWWFKRPTLRVYEGIVRNLKSYERLDPDDRTFFYREELKGRFSDEEEQLRNVRFVVIREGDFKDGDKFAIDYRKERGPRESLTIPYVRENDPTFTIEWDETAAHNVLKRAKPEHVPGAWLPRILPSAFAAPAEGPPAPAAERAASISPPAPAAPPRPAAALPAPTNRNARAKPVTVSGTPAPPAPAARPAPDARLNAQAKALVAVLQDSQTAVGEKIASVDQLSRYEAVGIATLMTSGTEQGPVASTLLELGRHSDPELSWKARALLKRYELGPAVARGLTSSSAEEVANAREILAAMDPAQAQQVLGQLPADKRKTFEPLIGAAGKQPLPTGTRSGDRYYVKAKWNPREQPAVDCLTKFFNHALLNKRTLPQEAAFMRGRKDRLVYGFEADWASWAASEIGKCGGQASFVVPWK